MSVRSEARFVSAIASAVVLPLLAAVTLLLSGCGSGESANAAAAAGEDESELVIFVFDRSTSISSDQLVRAEALTRDRLRILDAGDRIAAMQLLQLSLAEPPRRWSQSVPEGSDRGGSARQDSLLRVRFLRDAGDYLAQFADTAGRDAINGTDILATLHDVGEELRVREGGGATLYLFSDMRQSNRVIDMEGLRKMPPDGWIREQASAGTLPDLNGLCVVVVGARVDTEASQAVRQFWAEYFEATGAELRPGNYMYRPPALPERPCR